MFEKRIKMVAVLLALGLSGCSTAPVSFAVYGDMPYMAKVADGRTDEQVLAQDIAPRLRQRADVPFVMHMGDLGRPETACNDAWLEKTKAFWKSDIVKPVFYTPGDNDWTDCDRAKLPAPVSELGRLDAVRRIMFGTPLQVPAEWRYEQQVGQPENASWWYRGVRFVTQHIVSEGNGREQVLLDDPLRARALADERDARNLVWLDRAFAAARAADTVALVVGMQLDPFGAPDGKNDAFARCVAKPAYAPFCTHLQELAAKLDKPVLLVHGDTNAYCLDQPFQQGVAPRLWRLNAPGDYAVIDASIVAVDAGAAAPFKVTGVLSGSAAPAVCDYAHH